MPESSIDIRCVFAACCAVIAMLGNTAYALEIPMPAQAPCNCLGEDKEAELLHALRKDQRLWGMNTSEVVWRQLQLADFYARRNDYKKSDQHALLAHQINESLKAGKGAKYRADVAVRLGKNEMARNDFVEAERHARVAVQAARGNAKSADALVLLGWSLAEQKRYAEAVANYEKSLALRKKPSDEQTVMQMQQLASLYQKLGDTHKAQELFESGVARMAQLKGDRHPLTEFCRELLAANLMSQRKYDEARKVLSKVLADRTAVLGSDNPQLAGTLYQYASVLEMLNKPAEAASARNRAGAITRKLTKN